jgi:hypothetical protein
MRMLNLQGWEVGLLAVAALVAVTGLVRLMRNRRDVLTNELLLQAEQEHERQREEERKAKKQQQRKAS